MPKTTATPFVIDPIAKYRDPYLADYFKTVGSTFGPRTQPVQQPQASSGVLGPRPNVVDTGLRGGQYGSTGPVIDYGPGGVTAQPLPGTGGSGIRTDNIVPGGVVPLPVPEWSGPVRTPGSGQTTPAPQITAPGGDWAVNLNQQAPRIQGEAIGATNLNTPSAAIANPSGAPAGQVDQTATDLARQGAKAVGGLLGTGADPGLNAINRVAQQAYLQQLGGPASNKAIQRAATQAASPFASQGTLGSARQQLASATAGADVAAQQQQRALEQLPNIISAGLQPGQAQREAITAGIGALPDIADAQYRPKQAAQQAQQDWLKSYYDALGISQAPATANVVTTSTPTDAEKILEYITAIGAGKSVWDKVFD